MTSASDEALLRDYARGDPRAARALTDRLAPQAMAQATRMLGARAEAEEVVQEAMLRLWRIAPRWKAGRAKPSSWLYLVVNRLCLDRLRRNRHLGFEDAGLDAGFEPQDDAPSNDARMQQAARARALRGAVSRLPMRQAQAIALRYFEDLSVAEIAEIMRLKPRAVESVLARGKRGLMKILAKKKEELGVWDE